MQNEKMGPLTHSVIWFGAAVSIAEIMTGTVLAPLGLTRGLLAIIIGHIIGGALFFFAGLIGSKTGRSSMGTVKVSFGEKGSWLFSSLNVLQLVGWTAVMLIVGSNTAQVLLPLKYSWIWTLIMGALVAVWLVLGVKEFTRLNSVVMLALFGLTVMISLKIFRGEAQVAAEQTITFGQALELSAVMPLSWLPLVSDYTRMSKNDARIPLLSTVVYFLISCWMYAIGLGAALFAGQSDFTQILLQAGPGIAGMLIVLLSTVTTTFLDVYSGGVSAAAISKKIPEKTAAFVVCLLGCVFALFAPMTQYENFLYLIGSVFAPMIAVQIVDVLILRRRSLRDGQLDEGKPVPSLNWLNLLAWLIGFILYRVFIVIDLSIGNTLPVMLLTAAICWLLHLLVPRRVSAPN